ncbi:MAG: radical SAM protein [Candidatus Aenigmarchaeota archaeon]|nr:radical SAM protein [Candidatus Aenigmarchaeota archaeon]
MDILKYLKMIRKNNIAFIALTTKCNCRCLSCDMWKTSANADANKLSEYGFDRLMNSDFSILEFTGGEPLILENTPQIIASAKERDFFVQLMTNGTINSDKKMDGLLKSGVDMVCVSVDCHDNKRASAHRGFRNINESIKETVRKLADRGILLSSTTLITQKNYYDIDKTIEFINNDLGMYFSFCPPDFSENYKLGKNKSSVATSNEEMVDTSLKILEMKKNGYKILNTNAYIKDAIRWFSGQEPKYSCRAGKNMIYVDWNMKVYPCFIKKSICDLSELNKRRLKEIKCNQCTFQCFREPSIFYHGSGRLEFARDAHQFLRVMRESRFFK